MKKTLYSIAKKQQKRNGKREIVKALKIIRRDMKREAKKGRMSVSYNRISRSYEALIALRFLRRNSDLRIEFYTEDNSRDVSWVKICWD